MSAYTRLLGAFTQEKKFSMLQNYLGFFHQQEAEPLTQPAGHWPKPKQSTLSLPVWKITPLLLIEPYC